MAANAPRYNQCNYGEVAVIDTLKLARKLRDEGGMSDKQAEALAEGLNEALMDQVATKHDLELAVSTLRNQIWSGVVTVVLALGLLQHFLK